MNKNERVQANLKVIAHIGVETAAQIDPKKLQDKKEVLRNISWLERKVKSKSISFQDRAEYEAELRTWKQALEKLGDVSSSEKKAGITKNAKAEALELIKQYDKLLDTETPEARKKAKAIYNKVRGLGFNGIHFDDNLGKYVLSSVETAGGRRTQLNK